VLNSIRHENDARHDSDLKADLRLKKNVWYTTTIMKKIAIIGAGIAGVTCAHECIKKGYNVTLFDKSRGVSGRSTTKRWDGISGIGIDMGVPYIEDTHITNISKSFMNALIENKVVTQWPLTIHTKGDVITIKTWVGSPKMSQIARYLSNEIQLIATHKIDALSFNHTWALHAQNNVFEGFDKVIMAVPATQILDIDGVPSDIRELAQSIRYGAINTMLIEMKSPLWFDNYEEDRVDGPIIQTVIADYLKPNRVLKRFTYAVHSQSGWATKRFDELNKDEVTTIIVESLLSHYNRTPELILNTLTHQWKYAKLMGPSDSLQRGYIKSLEAPIMACGDWCHGHTFMSAIESGYLLAHNID
jgi:renalase